ncbi:response regulator [Acidisoma sp.]|uniref:response regulator n=1 Tax=Acidisoma sp. TaxID=1872115 RepID=UPI003AFF7D77
MEDDLLVGELLAELLGELGHDVCGLAQTEADAVAAAARHGPDLIMVDITLRQGNGLSAMRTIGQTSDARHVFMTGSGRHQFPEGAVILQKPFCEPDLLRALAEVFGPPALSSAAPWSNAVD